MSLAKKTPAGSYKDLLHMNNSNNGISAVLRNISDGDGTNTAVSISDRAASIKSSTNNTSAFSVQNSSGSNLIEADTTNNEVTVLDGTHVNTQIANFGAEYDNSTWAGASGNTHYAVPFNSQGYGGALFGGGTSTDPATSVTISNNSHQLLPYYFYVPTGIKVDQVTWFSAADASTGDIRRAHLMKYDCDLTADATAGNLSNGVVVASGSDISASTYDRVRSQTMTLNNPVVTQNQVLLFWFRADTVNSDYTVQATIKYHIT
jgi:hypothetical protein